VSSSRNRRPCERRIMRLDVITEAASSLGSSSQNVISGITPPAGAHSRAPRRGRDRGAAGTSINVRMRGAANGMRSDGAHSATEKCRRCQI
jgi:hypothetical protein